MPFLDGTGPRGMGPMTGRGMGYCAGRVSPGFPPARTAWFGRGRGRGFGRGMGRGWGMGFGRGFGRGWGPGWGRGMGWRAGWWDAPPHWGGLAYAAEPYGPPMSREEEVDFLKDEANAVKSQLEEIEARIRDLETSAEET